ncbi:MAG: tRNA (N6-isopentenyl adenosine(37)-C2)-methylthiotransferase MiaB, partial [Clostridia bacterium]|nr:tRNA (N6-isopentenyl adenosine(37)-C2)-methylthiotransferase MiaB [Clostridia bacterium]
MISGSGKKYYIRTFGCQQNEADSERIAGLCEEMGFSGTDTPGDADLIVVNTCAVREHAEKRALSVIGQYKHIKKEKPDMIIAVCGCMVSQGRRADQLKTSYPYVDFSFGTSDIASFPKLLRERLGGGSRRFVLPGEVSRITEGIPVRRACRFRGWISIMYGCDNFCSYCIVPYVRGR